MLKVLRLVLGYSIVAISFITSPRKAKRPPAQQAHINQLAEDLTLYQFYACPFCVKVRRALRRLNMPVATINAQQPEHKAELLEGGGRVKVPCLKIVENGSTQWLYESKAIVEYLEKRCA